MKAKQDNEILGTIREIKIAFAIGKETRAQRKFMRHLIWLELTERR